LTSDIGEPVADLLNSGTAVERRAARVIGMQQGQLQELLPPEVKAINSLWSRFVRLRDASYRTLRPEEGITPAAYQQAVRQNSVGNTFAKGAAVGQDLSDPAQILRMSPNSGLSCFPVALPLVLLTWRAERRYPLACPLSLPLVLLDLKQGLPSAATTGKSTSPEF
jgi:hypothetical protein